MLTLAVDDDHARCNRIARRKERPYAPFRPNPLFLLGALVVANSAHAAADTQFTEARLRAVEDFVQHEAGQARIPGFSLAVSGRNRVVFAKGYGASGGVAIHVDTPFQIGSLTKSFTALAAIQLAEAGRLDLDATVETYLDGFNSAARITVRHLLNQTSGLAGFAGFGSGSREDRIAELQSLASTATGTVGKTFEYSNANYEILGLIVEKMSGSNYVSYVQDSIFTPLGMSHSDVDPTTAMQRGLAHGHQDWFGINVVTRAFFSPAIPSAGGISSSAADMGRYLALHLNRGELGGVRIAASRFDELHRPPGEFSSYAMGWSLRKVGEHKVLLHNGSTPHFMATMLVAPDEGVGVVVLANKNSFNLPFVELPTRRMAAGAFRTLVEEIPATARSQDRCEELITKLVLLIGLLVSMLVLVQRTIPAWRKSPQAGKKVAVGALSDLVFAGVLLWGVPRMFGIPVCGLLEFVPDVAVILLLGAGLSLIRVVARVGLALNSRHAEQTRADPPR